MAHLGRAPAVPLEGLVGVGGQRRGVALEQRDLVAVAGTGASAAPEPGHAGPDHHDRCIVGPHDDCRSGPSARLQVGLADRGWLLAVSTREC